jgi:hypothetical protein
MLSFGSFFDGIGSAIASAINAFVQAIEAIGSFIGSAFSNVFSQGSQTATNVSSQTYSTTVHFVSDAKSSVSQSVSHTFTFSSPIKSVDVSLTIHNIASMHFQRLQIDFHIAGQTISVPITNPVSGQDITVDQTIPLPSLLSVVGITATISGTLCGSGCANLTFDPSADLIVSVPPQ